VSRKAAKGDGVAERIETSCLRGFVAWREAFMGSLIGLATEWKICQKICRKYARHKAPGDSGKSLEGQILEVHFTEDGAPATIKNPANERVFPVGF
jgi:hypothetical protein